MKKFFGYFFLIFQNFQSSANQFDNQKNVRWSSFKGSSKQNNQHKNKANRIVF